MLAAIDRDPTARRVGALDLDEIMRRIRLVFRDHRVRLAGLGLDLAGVRAITYRLQRRQASRAMKNPVRGVSAAASDAKSATMAAAAKNQLRYIDGSIRKRQGRKQVEGRAYNACRRLREPFPPDSVLAPARRRRRCWRGVANRRSRLMRPCPRPKRRAEFTLGLTQE